MTRIRLVISASLIAWAVPSTAEAACDGDQECNGGPARVMFIVDASSERLNDGATAATEGNSDWDMLRRVLADPASSVHDATVDGSGLVASQVVHMGVIAFGGTEPAPGEQKVMVDYGPCTQERVDWAMDPRTSCADPGCADPWSGPPIAWTFVDGSTIDPPDWFLPTVSHMPRCDGETGPCTGSGREVHLGIELARQNREAYLDTTPFTSDDTTTFANVLLVGDVYESDDAEVQAALEGAFGEGTITYVVGFGSATMTFEDQLANMAAWGSGGMQEHFIAASENELDAALAMIMADLEVPCCHTIDCAAVGGADEGGGGGTQGDTAATWGSADGDGSASASDSDSGTAGSVGGTITASDGDTESDSGKIDDDGGCTCRASGPRSVLSSWWLLVVLAWRRGSGRLCRRGSR